MLRKLWPVGLVLLVQLGILGAIPIKQLRALQDGIEITLETRPVDPYDLFSGYYVTLAYAVEVPNESQISVKAVDGEETFLVLEKSSPAWRLVAVNPNPVLTKGQVKLGATGDGDFRLELGGLKRLYIPESRRQEVDRLMRESEGVGLVDIRVDDNGNAALLRLRVGGQVFGE